MSRGARTPGPSARGAAPRTVTLAGAADVLAVLAFVAVGRRTHDAPGTALGTLGTAWPFLAGLAVGWLSARAWRAPTRLAPTGVVVWGVTLVVGMALRGVTGGGLAPAFVLVATGALAALLLGWRLVVSLAGRRGPAAG